jgi:hypothetical protein
MSNNSHDSAKPAHDPKNTAPAATPVKPVIEAVKPDAKADHSKPADKAAPMGASSKPPVAHAPTPDAKAPVNPLHP